MAQGHEELVVITRTYNLVLWSCHHTGRFPRCHRFVLGERIERNLDDLLETLIQARYTRDRQGLLRQANLTLEVLRFHQGAKSRSPPCVAPSSDGPAKGNAGPAGLVGRTARRPRRAVLSREPASISTPISTAALSMVCGRSPASPRATPWASLLNTRQRTPTGSLRCRCLDGL